MGSTYITRFSANKCKILSIFEAITTLIKTKASNILMEIITTQVTNQSIEKMKLDFLIYTILRKDGYDVTTESGNFIQSTTFRTVGQF